MGFKISINLQSNQKLWDHTHEYYTYIQNLKPNLSLKLHLKNTGEEYQVKWKSGEAFQVSKIGAGEKMKRGRKKEKKGKKKGGKKKKGGEKRGEKEKKGEKK